MQLGAGRQPRPHLNQRRCEHQPPQSSPSYSARVWPQSHRNWSQRSSTCSFLDMAELLRDNLEVQRQVASQDQSASTTGQSTLRNRQREIPHLLSWVSCFGVYMAVLTGKHPQMIKPLLAYQTMIVREARRCGGNGWLAYDRYFR